MSVQDDRYSHYTRLKFDKPHPRVMRITMDNGKMNTADPAMHAELVEVWRDVDADPEVKRHRDHRRRAVFLGGRRFLAGAGGRSTISPPGRGDGRKRGTSSTTASIARSRW